ncbi:MAG: hypothetical protein HY255_08750 [Betaproteobacteria bacterium]|nr:hypothetical protein [Betaproteobacteria bacterium]
MTINAVLACQLSLLIYHQLTTLLDFFPFNGARNYAGKERIAEAGVNALLMGLAVIGYGWQVHGLMVYGVIYYFVLFGFEIVIWWIPYFVVPAGSGRRLYNFLLGIATSDLSGGDTLQRWLAIHQRIHAGTITLLPKRQGRIVPNLEHTILHLWTLLTALVTLAYFLA